MGPSSGTAFCPAKSLERGYLINEIEARLKSEHRTCTGYRCSMPKYDKIQRPVSEQEATDTGEDAHARPIETLTLLSRGSFCTLSSPSP